MPTETSKTLTIKAIPINSWGHCFPFSYASPHFFSGWKGYCKNTVRSQQCLHHCERLVDSPTRQTTVENQISFPWLYLQCQHWGKWEFSENNLALTNHDLSQQLAANIFLIGIIPPYKKEVSFKDRTGSTLKANPDIEQLSRYLCFSLTEDRAYKSYI